MLFISALKLRFGDGFWFTLKYMVYSSHDEVMAQFIGSFQFFYEVSQNGLLIFNLLSVNERVVVIEQSIMVLSVEKQ